MDDRLARWAREPRQDPCVLLNELLAAVALGAAHGIRRDVLLFRTAKQKKAREVYQACVLLCAVNQTSGKPYRLIHKEPENSPIDVVAVLDVPQERRSHFFPIQLKELPQVARNPTITLESLLEGVAADTSVADTIVAIYLNRRFRLQPAEINVPGTLRARQLWLFGQPGTESATNPEDVLLIGDLMKKSEAKVYNVKLPIRLPEPPPAS